MSRLDRLVEVVLIGVYRTYDNLLRKSRIWSDSVSKAFGIIAPPIRLKRPRNLSRTSHFSLQSPGAGTSSFLV